MINGRQIHRLNYWPEKIILSLLLFSKYYKLKKLKGPMYSILFAQCHMQGFSRAAEGAIF